MIDCPRCGHFVDGLVCPKCRYSEGKAAAVEEGDRYQCAHHDGNGQRCVSQGSFTLSTMNRGPSGKGQSGPWYCPLHDPILPYPRTRQPESKAPSSLDLTPQQWANVCRFFPGVASKASAYSGRPLIRPDDPLWQSARQGPLFKGIQVPVAREPGSDDV